MKYNIYDWLDDTILLIGFIVGLFFIYERITYGYVLVSAVWGYLFGRNVPKGFE